MRIIQWHCDPLQVSLLANKLTVQEERLEKAGNDGKPTFTDVKAQDFEIQVPYFMILIRQLLWLLSKIWGSLS